MRINVKKAKEELAKEKAERTTLRSFRISENLYGRFQKRCKQDGFSTARVLEKLMEHYLDQ